MRIFVFIFIGLFVLTGIPAGSSNAYAQGASGDLAGSISRLQNNPKYRGRILGTHIVNQGNRRVYEVRILRPDDRVILVYIDPQTGGVVGDSTTRTNRSQRQRQQNRPSRQRRSR